MLNRYSLVGSSYSAIIFAGEPPVRLVGLHLSHLELFAFHCAGLPGREHRHGHY
jgi:hypothetical protein